MKRANVTVARQIKVIQNSIKKRVAWAQIVDAQTGQTLHTGQPGYIKRVAKTRYNVNTTFGV